MSTQHENSFLPTGAISTPGLHYDIPYYFSYPHKTDNNLQRHHHQPHFIYEQASVMSPPETRSGSTDDCNVSLLEDWSSFVQHLRNQFQGERAHMRADRDRMQEVIEGERELWDRERQIWKKERKTLKARITDLETKLLSVSDPTLNPSKVSLLSNHKSSFPRPRNSDNSSSTVIPQESGRNADGSPFYAPAPQNPNRTFNTEIASDLRVDDLAVSPDIAIRVTSKELTSLDFMQKTCPSLAETDSLEIIGESIDISHIQPELDSVAIRVSAVLPTFAAKVLPQDSRTRSNSQSKIASASKEKMIKPCDGINLEANCDSVRFSQSENKRLILFAGHTPNRCEKKFNCESDRTTPAQVESSSSHIVVPSFLEKQESDAYNLEVRDIDNDEELSEPLGLVNASGQDESFLEQLTEKLAQEVLKGAVADSSSESSPTQIDLLKPSSSSGSHEDEEADGSILRMKPSLNFGKPFGSV